MTAIVYRSALPAPYVPPVPVFDFLFEFLDAKDKDRTAFRECDGKGRSITYGDLKIISAGLGVGLRRRGLKKGDMVALMAPNSLDWVIVLMALQFVGCQAALINPLAFSSGTTGLPKAVELTHRNIISMVRYIMSTPDVRKGGVMYKRHSRLISILPFFHCFSLVKNLHTSLATRSTLYSLQRFDPQTFSRVIEQEAVDIAHLVPSVCLVLTKTPAANKASFRSLRFCSSGGAPLDLELQKSLREQLGVPVLQSWGMTETTVGCMGVDYDSPLGSVGKLMPGVEARLVDSHGHDVPRGQRGELWIRAANVCKGYYRDPEATAEAITKDGWLHTGDVGIIDENDSFTMVDRVKELIKYKGFQVAPAELEGVIAAHPKIAAAGVVGIYDRSQATELPRAYIQLQPHVTEARSQIEEEIMAWVKERCSPPKWLRGGVKVVERVPVSPSGKIVRKELRRMAEADQEKVSRPAKL
ncbi:unnamed protein product [Tilletia laevis]|uniref:AMP-dependent synthetase/ligase domain-containing protein n=2 Tax=Tilletia TaxID=13289 RepID=A0A9N8QFR0_9BASI|nr:unnamed protein product [Tilletia caries]CAD6939773.1 unnamed protein product [Tilletia laevis]CAD6958501.1 unnamed protein product [Tilletia caries]CAD6966240.1 unnamed protein product [Tilletia laevis]CAD7068948.1 unnamed protein product [Tilletia caries]